MVQHRLTPAVRSMSNHEGVARDECVDTTAQHGTSWRVHVVVAFTAVSGLLFGYDLCIITSKARPFL